MILIFHALITNEITHIITYAQRFGWKVAIEKQRFTDRIFFGMLGLIIECWTCRSMLFIYICMLIWSQLQTRNHSFCLKKLTFLHRCHITWLKMSFMLLSFLDFSWKIVYTYTRNKNKLAVKDCQHTIVFTKSQIYLKENV